MNKPLQKKGNNDIFKVPDNYFETLNDRIQDAIVAKQAQKEVVKFSIKNIRPLLYMAAMFVVIALTAAFVLTKTGKSDPSSLAISRDNKMEETTAEDYLLENLDSYEIQSYYIHNVSLK